MDIIFLHVLYVLWWWGVGRPSSASLSCYTFFMVLHSLWSFMLQAFGVHWVMPRTTAGLLSCSYQWLGKHNSNIWNLIPGCLMWIVWLERNRRSFENMEKTLDELKILCKRSLFEWARCWGFTDSSSLLEFMFSLSSSFWFPYLGFVVWFFCFLLFIIMNYLYFYFSSFISFLWLLIKKN